MDTCYQVRGPEHPKECQLCWPAVRVDSETCSLVIRYHSALLIIRVCLFSGSFYVFHFEGQPLK